MRILKLNEENKKNLLEDLLKRDPNHYTQYADAVQVIVDTVKAEGDRALFAYTEKFDHAIVTAENVRVTEDELQEAMDQVDPELVEVMKRALVNICLLYTSK